MEDYFDMVTHDKHRCLICCILGLSSKMKTFPTPLGDLGYKAELIESDRMPNSKGRTVAPDVILINDAINHILVTECKSGNLDQDQLDRYADVTPKDFKNWGLPLTRPLAVTNDVLIVSSYLNESKIMKSLRNFKCIFPMIQINLASIELLRNQFNRSELNAIFPISIKLSDIPQSLYPCCSNSPDWILFNEILMNLTSKLFENEKDSFSIKLEDLIRCIFPLWDKIGSDERKSINDRCRIIITDASKSNALKQYIDFKSDMIDFKIKKYKSSRTLTHFQTEGTAYLQTLKKNGKQQTLNNYS